MNGNRTDRRGAEDLRSRRVAAGLTQQRLADLAGCSISIVGLLERGLTPQRSDVLPRIEQVLAAASNSRNAAVVSGGVSKTSVQALGNASQG